MLKAIQQDASRLPYTASQQAALDHMIQGFHEAKAAHTESTAPTGTFRREGPKIGRNEVCPCGSGLKYKRCCGSTQASSPPTLAAAA